MYTDDRVIELISGSFLPVRVHVRDQADDFRRLGERYSAQWTPTILFLDGGVERHRIEGFLPVEDFLDQLGLGLGRIRVARGEFAEAERAFGDVASRHPDGDAAAEAVYWAGVSRYKASGDGGALLETGERLRDRYPDTAWAKKGSVWLG